MICYLGYFKRLRTWISRKLHDYIIISYTIKTKIYKVNSCFVFPSHFLFALLKVHISLVSNNSCWVSFNRDLKSFQKKHSGGVLQISTEGPFASQNTKVGFLALTNVPNNFLQCSSNTCYRIWEILMYEKLDGVMRVRNQHKKKKNSNK